MPKFSIYPTFTQRIILAVGAALLLATFLFPQWLKTKVSISGYSAGGESLGYWFLFAPPQAATVNTSLLVIQIIVVITVTLFLYLAAMPKQPKPQERMRSWSSDAPPRN